MDTVCLCIYACMYVFMYACCLIVTMHRYIACEPMHARIHACKHVGLMYVRYLCMCMCP